MLLSPVSCLVFVADVDTEVKHYQMNSTWTVMLENHHYHIYPPQLLPTPVDPSEAEEMFNFADKDRDSR